MSYKCRPGMVLTKICGEWLLIPTREASEQCPRVINLGLPALIVWGMVRKEKTEEEMRRALGILLHKEGDETRETLNGILQLLLEKKAVIEE